MPRPDFQTLCDDLLRAGVSPLHARRAVDELGDHFEDLVLERLEGGLPRDEAECEAGRQLGNLDVVAEHMRADPGLRSWAWRWPRIALLVYPLACVAALPAVPFVAGAAHRDSIARWMTGMLFAGAFTASLFLLLQLAITMAASGVAR